MLLSRNYTGSERVNVRFFTLATVKSDDNILMIILPILVVAAGDLSVTVPLF